MDSCRLDLRQEQWRGSPSPCVRESRQHTVSNVGHSDGSRTDGIVDETTRSPIAVSDGSAHCLFVATNGCGPWDVMSLGLLLRVSIQQQRPHMYHHGGSNSESVCYQVRHLTTPAIEPSRDRGFTCCQHCQRTTTEALHVASIVNHHGRGSTYCQNANNTTEALHIASIVNHYDRGSTYCQHRQPPRPRLYMLPASHPLRPRPYMHKQYLPINHKPIPANQP